jgi:hypothetical protein
MRIVDKGRCVVLATVVWQWQLTLLMNNGDSH